MAIPLVNFITGNANKLHEVKAILEPTIKVESQALDLIEIQGTLEEVTIDKCRRAADLVNLPPSLDFQKKFSRAFGKAKLSLRSKDPC